MKLHELSPAEGSTRPNFRKGRGAGSGNGKTGGRGHKGQNARSVYVPALRVVSCLFTENFRRGVSTTISRSIMQSSTFQLSMNLRPVKSSI